MLNQTDGSAQGAVSAAPAVTSPARLAGRTAPAPVNAGAAAVLIGRSLLTGTSGRYRPAALRAGGEER